jgi:hypothetical protein
MVKNIINPFQLLVLAAAFALYGCDADDDLPASSEPPEIEQPASGLRTMQSSGVEREYYLQVPRVLWKERLPS